MLENKLYQEAPCGTITKWSSPSYSMNGTGKRRVGISSSIKASIFKINERKQFPKVNVGVLCCFVYGVCTFAWVAWLYLDALAETKNVWVPSSIFLCCFLPSFVYMYLFMECVHVCVQVCMCMPECLAQQSDGQRTCGIWLFPSNQTQAIIIGKREQHYVITYFLTFLFLSLSLLFLPSLFPSFLSFFFFYFFFLFFDKDRLIELGTVLVTCHHA